jgi:catechol 2,3-dioxygenase-like lactoylglutathione lyase family enzyme
MLKDGNAIATIAVSNLDAAKRFYEGTLGLEVAEMDEPGGVTYRSGDSRILVYESQFAGTNRATSATWIVGDELEDIVRTLKAKGVAFEHYDLPDTSRKGDIHESGDIKVAWFKDPDGNIINLASG